MIDIKILAVRDLLPIAGVKFAKVDGPRSLEITGELFQQATQVVINDVESPEFIIISDNRLVAQIPHEYVNSVIRKVTVLAEKPSPGRRSLLLFEIGRSFNGLQGIERMVQAYCKILLQTPGTDQFHKAIGGGLLSLVGVNVRRGASNALQAAVVSAISRARDQLVQLQNRNRRIPLDERLLSARADGVAFDPNTTTLSARVHLTAASGRQAVANLTF